MRTYTTLKEVKVKTYGEEEYIISWINESYVSHSSTRSNWVVYCISKDIRCRVMLPPKIWQPIGRPRKEIIHSSGEVKYTQCCGRYGDYEHNKKNMQTTNPITSYKRTYLCQYCWEQYQHPRIFITTSS